MKIKSTAVIAALASLLMSSAHSQTYPAKPIVLVVPYAAGGGTDILARHLAEGMSNVLGGSVVVENRPGAGTNLAANFVAKAEPDGYTLLMGDLALAANPSLFRNMQYKPMDDLFPIAMVASAPLVLVTSPTSKLESVPQIVAAAKSSPGKLTFGTAGNGNPPHLAAEAFRSAAGIDLVKVPYKGVGPALTDVLGARLSMLFTGISSTKALIEEGKLKALAVTGAKRTSTLPGVPTMAEEGFPQLIVSSWWGLFGPTNLPPEVVSALSSAVEKTLASPAVRKKLDDLNIDAGYGGSDALRMHLRKETERWSAVIRDAKITPD